MISKEAQKSIQRYKKYASFISSFYRTPSEISNWRVGLFRWFIDLQGTIGPKAKGTVKEDLPAVNAALFTSLKFCTELSPTKTTSP